MESALVNLPKQQQLRAIMTQTAEGRSSVADTSVARANTFRVDAFGPPRPPGDRGFPQPPLDSARAAASRASATGSGVPLMAPPPEGTRRLVMMPFSNRTRDTSFKALGSVLLDSISASLQTSRGRLEIISAEQVQRAFGNDPPRATSVGFSLRANFVVGGLYFVRNDSLVVVTGLIDVQGGAGTRYHETAAPLAQRMSVVSPTATWVRARLDTLRREMLRRPTDGLGSQRR